jgi:hypothetical protein
MPTEVGLTRYLEWYHMYGTRPFFPFYWIRYQPRHKLCPSIFTFCSFFVCFVLSPADWSQSTSPPCPFCWAIARRERIGLCLCPVALDMDVKRRGGMARRRRIGLRLRGSKRTFNMEEDEGYGCLEPESCTSASLMSSSNRTWSQVKPKGPFVRRFKLLKLQT